MIQWIRGHKAGTTGIAFGVLLLLVVSFAKANKISPVSWGLFGNVNSTEGVALGGYDPVAYHNGGEQAANASHETTHAGLRWRFSSASNLEQFTKNPDQYMPAFGGFCAFAVSKGFTANANPTVFHLKEDKIYLFDSDAVKEDFLANEAENIQLAQSNWAKR